MPAAAPSAEPQTFESMGLHPELRQALLEMGFIDPMPVQRAVYPRMMAGRDLMVQSRTGSGKTAAFGIPFAQGLISPDEKRVQALVLAPTRELALQVAVECGRIASYRNLTVVPVYGGAPMGKQIEALRAGAQIVAGTPGRVLDHLRRGTLKLDGLKVLVLDEADEMLSMGFYEEITDIIKQCPVERQTVLFSATIPEDIERIGSRYMRTPEKIALSTVSDGIGVREIKHAYYLVSGMGRARDLVRVLEVERPESAIIFCNTREDTALVAEFLRRSGLDAEAISSDLTQKDRERVMGRMKDKALHYLVATDIAARGIDITDLSHVINYTFPESAEVYVHRTGRTGRAGKSGVAISLIAPRELGNFYMLKLTYKIKPEERFLPSEAEAKTIKEAAKVDELKQLIGSREASAEWRAIARRLWSSEDGERIVAALIADRLAAARAAAAAQNGGARATAGGAVTATSGGETAENGAAAEGAATYATVTNGAATGDRREPPSAPRLERRDRGPRRDGSRDERRERNARGGRRARGRDEAPRDKKPERSDEPKPRNDKPERVAETIDDSDGREFWEAWVDSKTEPEADARPDDARPDDDRPRRERERDLELSPGQLRLYLNLGRRDGLKEPEVQQLLAERGVTVDALQVRSSHTYLVVTEANAASVCGALHGQKHNERDIVCEPARK
jgi:ATP-dependent RNA helicase DeaD